MPRFFFFDVREGTRFGLVPRTTPLESPQSNGMAEAFVRTLKRDYVRLSPVPDGESVLRQLPGWLAHYNELHPHRAVDTLRAFSAAAIFRNGVAPAAWTSSITGASSAARLTASAW